MKEKDILHENGDFWVTKDSTLELPYLILKNTGTHALGFLSCDTLEKAVENCNAFVKNPEFVAKHFHI